MADEAEKKVEETTPADEVKNDEQAKQEDLNNRINGFLKAYGELVATYKVDFATYPMFVPDGQGGFKIVSQNTPVDMSNQPIRSDFMAKE